MDVNVLEPIFTIEFCSYTGWMDEWRIAEIAVPYWRCYCNLDPGAWINISGRRCDLVPGYAYLIPPYLRTSTDNVRPVRQFFIHFRMADNGGMIRESRRIELSGAMRGSIDRYAALEEEEPSTAVTRQLIATEFLSELFLTLPPELLLQEYVDPRVYRITRLLRLDFSRRWSNGELAARVNLARNSFVRLFSRHTGESPQSFSRRLRLEHACSLLQEGTSSLKEIAEITGFTDQYHLSRMFRRQFGCPPGVYRERHAQISGRRTRET